MRGARRICAQHELGVLDDLARQLPERVCEQGDVVAGVVGAGVAGPQHPGQRLTGGGLAGTVEVGRVCPMKCVWSW